MRKNIRISILSGSLLLWSVAAMAQPVEGKKYSDHYHKRYAIFEAERPVGNRDIVFLGNSLTQGGEWTAYFVQTETALALNGGGIRNRGIIGDDAPGIYDRLNQVLPGKPKKIFLLVGVNDISHHLSADSVLVLAERVLERIQRETPDTKLYLQSLLPINTQKNKYKSMTGKSGVIKEVNAGLKRLAKRRGIPFIDLYPSFTERKTDELRPDLTSDGLHINAAGYAIWAKQIKKYVK